MPTSTVFNIDCMEYMRTCRDKQFGLAICDIPYGIKASTMAFTREVSTAVTQRNGTKSQISKRKPYAQKTWDESPPPQAYFDELKRISHDQIIFGIDYVQWQGVGAGRIKWDKCFPDKVSFNRYEVAYCSLINKTTEVKLLWAGMQQAKSLSEPCTAQGNKQLNEKRIHPTQKPFLLYKLLLSMYAHTGENIIDTHCGSQSSRLAAFDLDMNYVGCELDKDYFDAGNKRFENFKAQLKMF